MSWLIQIWENWISVTYLEEFLNYVVHPRWLFLLPILIYSLWLYFYFVGCAISFLLFAYKKMNNHQETDFYSKFWDKARQVMAPIYELLGKIWYGHEIVGMEHLPKGPGIVILHHPIIVVGYTFFLTKVYKETGRLCHTVIHHGLYRIPGSHIIIAAAFNARIEQGVKQNRVRNLMIPSGLKFFYDVLFLRNFKKAECVEILKKGHLLGITPGGGLEANFSNDYTLMWNNRTGFARLALEAKVPIIPIFTQNSCEAYRTFGKTRLTKWLQKKFPGFLLPIYGGFPVKLRTYIGEPIPYDPNISATELAEKAKTALENLRDRHQKLPGNTLRALSERFDKQYKANKSM